MALTLILSVGLDSDLLGSRNLVLQSAGYTVVSAHSVKEAVQRFQAGDFDLVLLCQSISMLEKERLTSWIRASGSRIPVVCVSGKLLDGYACSSGTVGSNPEALLAGIKEALTEAATHGPLKAIRNEPEAASPANKKPLKASEGSDGQEKATEKQSIRLAS